MNEAEIDVERTKLSQTRIAHRRNSNSYRSMDPWIVAVDDDL